MYLKIEHTRINSNDCQSASIASILRAGVQVIGFSFISLHRLSHTFRG